MFDKSVIITPTLNEKANLEKLIPAIFDFMPQISVLIVDDNSGDGTGEYIDLARNKYPNLFFLNRTKHLGYGKACVAGFLWSLGCNFEYIITMDADFSHDYRAIPGMLEKLADNGAVIGSRYVKGGRIQNWKLHRRILSKAANFYVRLILGTKISDLTTGFNAYKKDIFPTTNLGDIKSDGYAFLVELKYRLEKNGVKITEYPIIFSERREGQSKMSARIIWESVKLPWRLKNKNFAN